MSDANRPSPLLIAIGLKMYFDHERTIAWSSEIIQLARQHLAISSHAAELVLLPSFPSLSKVSDLARGSLVQLGAQNVAADELGPFTGEVSAQTLRQVGCTFVEVGHYERRLLFHEDEPAIAQKVARALGAGLVPIVCVGEQVEMESDAAVNACLRQLDAALSVAESLTLRGRVVVAYEPAWAIGGSLAAPAKHVSTVARALRSTAVNHPVVTTSQVIYGGSAGPGLLSAGLDVDGLFLGRFAHGPEAVSKVLDEVVAEDPEERGDRGRAQSTTDIPPVASRR